MDSGSADTTRTPTNASPRWITGTLVVALVAIVASGVFTYETQRRQARAAAESELASVGRMRSDQVARWRAERLEEAASAITVGALLDGHSSSSAAIDAWLAALIADERHAQAMIVSADGEILHRTGGDQGSLCHFSAPELAEALRSGRPVMTDLHVGPADPAPHVDVVAPFALTDGGRPAAALVLRTHAEGDLYSLLNAWPGDSPSAETLLVRRDGETAVFLSGRRHDGVEPLTERVSLAQNSLPAVMAVTGTEGIVEGADYRGVQVLAALAAVPGSRWSIVAKVDVSEALAVWHRQSALLLMVIVGLAALVLAALAVLWQRNRKAQYRALFRAEAAQRQGEQRYRTTLMSLGDGVITTNAKGKVELLNPVAEELSGWSWEDALGRNLAEVFPLIDELTGQRLDCPGCRAVSEGVAVSLPNHTVLESRQGQRRPVAVTVAPIFDEQRRARGVVLVFRDQTATNEAQEALRHSEGMLRESQRVAQIGHYSFDIVAGTWSSSETLDEVFGIDASYLRDLAGWLALIPEEWQPEMEDHVLVHVIQQGNEFDKEYPIRRVSDGAEHWVHGRGRLRYDASGAPLEMFGTIQDITTRKVAEAAARAATAAAEAERSSLEAQLRQAQKMESIGQLAGGVAHDFNNLLSVIVSCAELSMDALPDEDPVRDDLAEIRRAANRGAQLTRQLLAFSRRQIMQPAVVDLSEIIGGMEPMLRRLIGEDITLVVRAGSLLRPVRVDPGQIEQAVMNLAVNARDAMPRGGRLSISTENVDVDPAASLRHRDLAPGPYVMVRATDTGCGMEPQVLERMFEPFFTTKERGKGTGLGLATVYGIVRQSGGDIHVTSRPGEGSVFEIYLPQAVGQRVERPVERIADSLSTGTETVLVVEDEDPVRRAVERILAAAGYTVLTASSGGEALRVCARYTSHIHLLLTDVVMPGMGGKELVEQLQVDRPGVASLYMSGYTDDAIVRHGTLEPGTQFIGKPFSAAELTAKVRQVLDAQRAAAVYTLNPRRLAM